MYQTIMTAQEGGTRIITINRPEKLNALNAQVIHELATELEAALSEEGVKSIILTGAGEKAFVAGADISEFTTLNEAEGKALAAAGQQRIFSKIEQSAKPVLAAVNGFALGGGCELAMACHLRVAASHARFGQPEINLGLVPGYGGTQRLVHLVGKGKALEMLLTGDMVGAEEAMQIGLVNKVSPADELMSQSLALLRLIESKAPRAVEEIIHLVNTAIYQPAQGLAEEVERFGQLFSTEDVREGTRAFLEKRKPAFSGK